MPDLNTTELDYRVPSLRAIGQALTVEDFYLPEGYRIDEVDYRDCLRPGARSGEVIFRGTGPRQIDDEWDDDDGEHHVETSATYWGFRVVIDQIGAD